MGRLGADFLSAGPYSAAKLVGNADWADPVESAIWTYIPETKQLVPTWVNTDGNASTTQVVFTGSGLLLVTNAAAYGYGDAVVSVLSR
jgi:hypothetical protein